MVASAGLIPKECEVCGGKFTAKRDAARFCSPRCQMRNSRAVKRGEVPAPMRREGGAVVSLEPQARESAGFYATTKAVLEDAGRLATPRGQAVMLMTEILTSGVQDTGSSIASLIRQWDALLDKALDGAVVSESPAERLRRERDARVA